MKWTEHEHAAYLKRQGYPPLKRDPQAPGQSATEGEFQAWVLDLANRNGWLAYHTYDSRKSGPGFPDLILVKGGVMIAAELKSADVKSMSLDQARWLAALGCVPGVRAVVWQPCDAESIIGQLETEEPSPDRWMATSYHEGRCNARLSIAGEVRSGGPGAALPSAHAGRRQLAPSRPWRCAGELIGGDLEERRAVQ